MNTYMLFLRFPEIKSINYLFQSKFQRWHTFRLASLTGGVIVASELFKELSLAKLIASRTFWLQNRHGSVRSEVHMVTWQMVLNQSLNQMDFKILN